MMRLLLTETELEFSLANREQPVCRHPSPHFVIFECDR